MKILPVLLGSAVLFSVACDTNKKETKITTESNPETVEVENKSSENTKAIMEKDGLKVYEAPSEIEYPTARLELRDPIGEKLNAEVTKFDFAVLDYQLKGQTKSEKTKTLANSEQGQHIHFILNNAPYQAKYEPSFEAELMEGNNVVLAFLSKSFHESVKTKTAYFFHNFYVGEGKGDFDENAPHLFYSRPKGEYKMSKAKQLLFDFYLLNAELSANGNQVKLTIDDTEFMINDWKAYLVEGLELGEHTFRIELVDQDGNMIDGPFNDSGVRTITIVEG